MMPAAQRAGPQGAGSGGMEGEGGEMEGGPGRGREKGGRDQRNARHQHQRKVVNIKGLLPANSDQVCN